MQELEPWGYLRDLLCLLPEWPKHRVLELAPAYWKANAALVEVQERLDQNPFRALTLGRG